MNLLWQLSLNSSRDFGWELVVSHTKPSMFGSFRCAWIWSVEVWIKRTFYVMSLRANLILTCQEVLKMNWAPYLTDIERSLCIPTPSMHQKLTEHGMLGMQNNQLPITTPVVLKDIYCSDWLKLTVMLHWDFKVSGFGTSGLGKICGPAYVVTLLNWTSIFKWYMARLAVRNGHQKRQVSRWDWTMRSDYKDHSRLTS